MGRIIQCITLAVDCVRKPDTGEYLGFRFDVPTSVSNQIADYIRTFLPLNKIPFSDIYACGMTSMDEKYVTTLEDIKKAILARADYLRSVAKNGNYKK